MAIIQQEIDARHEKAVMRTKQHIKSNLKQYLETEENPRFQEYLSKQKAFLEGVWQKKWREMLVSSFSGDEKAAYLNETGRSPGQINRLFYRALEDFRPFNGYEWAKSEYKDKWSQLAKSTPYKEKESRKSKGKERERLVLSPRKTRAQVKQAERQKRLSYIFGEEYTPAPLPHVQYVVHVGDTNTGKTYTALEELKKRKSGLYLAPLRLLALEVYEKLNREGVLCDMKTGEEEKRTEGASHASCTIEMFEEKTPYDIIVIDEAQMIQDRERGFHWFRSITRARAKEVHIIGSPNMKNLVLGLLGEEANVEVRHYKRETPLIVCNKAFGLNRIQKGDALVAFSRKRVLQLAAKLEDDGHGVSVIYGNMPPESRQRQMEDFVSGKTQVVVATDAIGMGLNLPIRRIILMDSHKFDGVRRRILTTQEVKQIAGRAGRRGLYDQGEVIFMEDRKRMKELLERDDAPIQMFTIAPTRSVLKRFLRYYQDLDTFFSLWAEFTPPRGTQKASLAQEKLLYGLVKGTPIEDRLLMEELYSYLQMPFSAYEKMLSDQWKLALASLIGGTSMPEPAIQKGSLEKLELSYKAVELHLMFLYRQDQITEAYYWERVKKELADDIHQWLDQNMKTLNKACSRCGRQLDWDYPHGICQQCYGRMQENWYEM